MNIVGMDQGVDALHGDGELNGFAALLPALMPMAQNLLGKLGMGATGAAPAAARPYVRQGVDIATKLAMQRMQSELSRMKSQNQTRQIIDLIKARTQPPPAPRAVAPVYAAPAPAYRTPVAPPQADTKKSDMMPLILAGGAGLLLLMFMMKK